eukprot:4597050-Alexandrium_andersonii.AAC.1
MPAPCCQHLGCLHSFRASSSGMRQLHYHSPWKASASGRAAEQPPLRELRMRLASRCGWACRGGMLPTLGAGGYSAGSLTCSPFGGSCSCRQ